MKKIVHENKKCAGCGVCAAVCPDFFEFDVKNNVACLKKSAKNKDDCFEFIIDLTPRQSECIERAAKICPLKLIRIEEI